CLASSLGSGRLASRDARAARMAASEVVQVPVDLADRAAHAPSAPRSAPGPVRPLHLWEPVEAWRCVRCGQLTTQSLLAMHDQSCSAPAGRSDIPAALIPSEWLAGHGLTRADVARAIEEGL
ncbi:MAG: hypothetical protein J2P32_11025, partial [Actinobacteria bacterium]|nr:hypothetical protein [Actinomycetota bacterium]